MREVRWAVAGHTVVADVSRTLVDALNTQLALLTPAARAELNDLSGGTPAGTVLTITLYEILEDVPSRNRPPVQTSNGQTTTIRKPPMALLLRYLLTPWGGDQATVQQMVGRAMQVLYDDAILDGPQLRGSLVGLRDTLKVTLAPLTLEERTRVWWAIGKPYRLSLNYVVRVVNLDALDLRTAPPVLERALDAAEREGGP